MAGVKGRSGGKREGAGRKPAPKPEPGPTNERDPLAFLLNVMQGNIDPTPSQLRAAVAAAQYMHAKKEGGKKDVQKAAAEDVAGGKFGARQPPKLVANNR